MKARERADAALAAVAAAAADLAARSAALASDIEAVQARHEAGIAAARERLEDLEAELMAILALEDGELFPGEEDEIWTGLAHGTVIRRVSRPVLRARKVLARLKELGWTEAIRTAESVDWPLLETWDDARLGEAGTRRKPAVNEYAYELAAKTPAAGAAGA